MSNQYKQTVRGTVGAGMKSVFAGGGKKYYILEHKMGSSFHRAGETQEIIVDQILLGRDAQCQVRFDDTEQFKTVSRRHAAIVREGDNWKLVQLSTTNKTLLNGTPVEKEWFLQNGDEIQLSVNGPKLGFIIPQGDKATTKSIGLSRRLSLFRQQALRPYKTALTILSILFVLAVAAGTYFIVKGNQENKELRRLFYEDSVRHAAQIDSLNIVIQKIDLDNQKFLDDLKNMKPADPEKKKQLEEMEIIFEEPVEEVSPEVTEEVIQEENPAEGLETDAEEIIVVAPESSPVVTIETSSTEQPVSMSVSEEQPSTTTRKVGVTKNILDNIYYIHVIGFTIEDEKTGKKQEVQPFDSIGEGENAVVVDGWTGTAFLLSDGKMVTARHCVESWLSLQKMLESDWLLRLNNLVTNGGYKVSVELLAVSPKGDRIVLSSKNVKCDRSKDTRVAIANGETFTVAPESRDGLDFAWFDTELKEGLEYDKELSRTLPMETELRIYGYPHQMGVEWGNKGIHRVRPVLGKAEVAYEGLWENVILTCSSSFGAGHSGSPVFYVDKDGNYTVVGILSSSLYGEEGFGIIMPISKIK